MSKSKILEFNNAVTQQNKELTLALWLEDASVQAWCKGSKIINCGSPGESNFRNISPKELIDFFRIVLTTENQDYILEIWNQHSSLQLYFRGEKPSTTANYPDLSPSEMLYNYKLAQNSKCQPLIDAIENNNPLLEELINRQEVNFVEIETESLPSRQSFWDELKKFESMLGCRKNKEANSLWKENFLIHDYFCGLKINLGTNEHPVFHQKNFSEQIKALELTFRSRYAPIIKEVWNENKKISNACAGKKVNFGTESNPTLRVMKISELTDLFHKALKCRSFDLVKEFWSSNVAYQAWVRGEKVDIERNSAVFGTQSSISDYDLLQNFDLMLATGNGFCVEAIWLNNQRLIDLIKKATDSSYKERLEKLSKCKTTDVLREYLKLKENYKAVKGVLELQKNITVQDGKKPRGRLKLIVDRAEELQSLEQTKKKEKKTLAAKSKEKTPSNPETKKRKLPANPIQPQSKKQKMEKDPIKSRLPHATAMSIVVDKVIAESLKNQARNFDTMGIASIRKVPKEDKYKVILSDKDKYNAWRSNPPKPISKTMETRTEKTKTNGETSTSKYFDSLIQLEDSFNKLIIFKNPAQVKQFWEKSTESFKTWYKGEELIFNKTHRCLPLANLLKNFKNILILQDDFMIHAFWQGSDRLKREIKRQDPAIAVQILSLVISLEKGDFRDTYLNWLDDIEIIEKCSAYLSKQLQTPTLAKQIGFLKSYLKSPEKERENEPEKILLWGSFFSPNKFKVNSNNFSMENFLEQANKKFKQFLMSKNQEQLDELWYNDYIFRTWFCGNGPVNFSSNNEQDLRTISNVKLLENFVLLVNYKQIKFILEMWEFHQVLHESIRLLPNDAAQFLLDELLKLCFSEDLSFSSELHAFLTNFLNAMNNDALILSYLENNPSDNRDSNTTKVAFLTSYYSERTLLNGKKIRKETPQFNDLLPETFEEAFPEFQDSNNNEILSNNSSTVLSNTLPPKSSEVNKSIENVDVSNTQTAHNFFESTLLDNYSLDDEDPFQLFFS